MNSQGKNPTQKNRKNSQSFPFKYFGMHLNLSPFYESGLFAAPKFSILKNEFLGF